MPGEPLEPLLETWSTAHDRHLQEVADLVDRVVEARGEERLGELWADLQADGSDFYRATYGPEKPWSASAERLIQVAIEGMHGHLGGPTRRGEVTVAEHDDRVAMTFHTCGSGGRILAAGRNSVVAGTHDFAWSTPGVCSYCVHCCVLQQLTPIDDFGYPARVIDPPTRPGDPCTWTVYRDPSLVPAEAYERVGRTQARWLMYPRFRPLASGSRSSDTEGNLRGKYTTAAKLAKGRGATSSDVFYVLTIRDEVFESPLTRQCRPGFPDVIMPCPTGRRSCPCHGSATCRR